MPVTASNHIGRAVDHLQIIEGRIGRGEQVMTQQPLKEPFDRIDATKGKELYDSQNTVWIDVREPGEWQDGRIPGSTLVPLNTLLLSPRQYLSKDNVVFYCAQGIRSAVACEVAAAVGLTKIYNLEGGIIEWAAKGFPVEK
jgi:rhodanese-related sulfurtransferase